jgi:hypothetical protein
MAMTIYQKRTLPPRFRHDNSLCFISRAYRLFILSQSLGCRKYVRSQRRRPQTADGGRQTADGRPQTADGRPRTADGRPQTADGRRQTADRRPRTTYVTIIPPSSPYHPLILSSSHRRPLRSSAVLSGVIPTAPPTSAHLSGCRRRGRPGLSRCRRGSAVPCQRSGRAASRHLPLQICSRQW